MESLKEPGLSTDFILSDILNHTGADSLFIDALTLSQFVLRLLQEGKFETYADIITAELETMEEPSLLDLDRTRPYNALTYFQVLCSLLRPSSEIGYLEADLQQQLLHSMNYFFAPHNPAILPTFTLEEATAFTAAAQNILGGKFPPIEI